MQSEPEALSEPKHLKALKKNFLCGLLGMGAANKFFRSFLYFLCGRGRLGASKVARRLCREDTPLAGNMQGVLIMRRTSCRTSCRVTPSEKKEAFVPSIAVVVFSTNFVSETASSSTPPRTSFGQVELKLPVELAVRRESHPWHVLLGDLTMAAVRQDVKVPHVQERPVLFIFFCIIGQNRAAC